MSEAFSPARAATFRPLTAAYPSSIIKASAASSNWVRVADLSVPKRRFRGVAFIVVSSETRLAKAKYSNPRFQVATKAVRGFPVSADMAFFVFGANAERNHAKHPIERLATVFRVGSPRTRGASTSG
ncbi:MAG: hypothetical protein ACSLE1_00615 [Sphingobium sp.]